MDVEEVMVPMVAVVELVDGLEVEVEEYQLILWMNHSMLTFRCMPTVCSAQHTFFFSSTVVITVYPAQLESPPYGGGRGGGGGGHVSARQASAPNSEPHTPNRGRGNRGFRGRGRGRGHLEINSPNRYSDIGIGTSSNVRGRGRGGRFQQRLRPDAPLTSLLYQERPLLRPIVFVPSTLHPVLFDQVEDLLKPVVEEVGTFFLCFFLHIS